MKYRYRVAVMQQGRISHENGSWLGTLDPTEPGAIDTCPETYDYLNEAGAEGWRLVTTSPLGELGVAKSMFLERAER